MNNFSTTCTPLALLHQADSPKRCDELPVQNACLKVLYRLLLQNNHNEMRSAYLRKYSNNANIHMLVKRYLQKLGKYSDTDKSAAVSWFLVRILVKANFLLVLGSMLLRKIQRLQEFLGPFVDRQVTFTVLNCYLIKTRKAWRRAGCFPMNQYRGVRWVVRKQVRVGEFPAN